MTRKGKKINKKSDIENWFYRNIILHFGGNFTCETSKFGPAYKYEGGEFFDLGRVGGEGLNFLSFHKIVSFVFATKGAKEVIIYALNDGIRFRVDDDQDLSVQWQTLPTDGEAKTHFYLVNEISINTQNPSGCETSSPVLEPPKPLVDTPSKNTRSKSKSQIETSSPVLEPATVEPVVPRSSNIKIKDFFGKGKESPLKKLPVKRKSEAG